MRAYEYHRICQEHVQVIFDPKNQIRNFILHKNSIFFLHCDIIFNASKILIL